MERAIADKPVLSYLEVRIVQTSSPLLPSGPFIRDEPRPTAGKAPQ
jgi:hypothetical protein